MRVISKKVIRSDAGRRIIGMHDAALHPSRDSRLIPFSVAVAASPAPSMVGRSQDIANNTSTCSTAPTGSSSAGYTRLPARSHKRRRLATPQLPQQRVVPSRKANPLTSARRMIVERHWTDCSACRTSGKDCIPPVPESNQRKCWRCREKLHKFCDCCFWMDVDSVAKFKQLLNSGIDVEEVDKQVWGSFPGVLGGPFDKCKSYSFAAESTSNDHQFAFNPALHTL